MCECVRVCVYMCVCVHVCMCHYQCMPIIHSSGGSSIGHKATQVHQGMGPCKNIIKMKITLSNLFIFS